MACLLVGGSLPALADQPPTKQNDASQPAEVVSSFFHDVLEIAFVHPDAADGPARVDALKLILAQTIDAGGIGHFILGRYARTSQLSASGQSMGDPGSDFLDFAARQIMRMAPASSGTVNTAKLPSLAISNAADRSDQTHPDQTHMVFSELVWPDGHRLPLAWELADRPGTGLRIEDVSCLGISLRLMLRSAVAEAAAEHPEKRANLAGLLDAGNAFGRLPATAPESASPAQ